jgi:uncharacterized surface protein with fasciclin (FAS1) repeats
MYLKYKSKHFFSVFVLFAMLVACTDKFDDYYNNTQYEGSNLLQVLESQPKYSEFVELIKITGYDSVLISPNNYTVFAPINGSFGQLNRNNLDSLKLIVGSYIVPSTIYDNAITNQRIATLSGKYMLLAKVGGKSVFDNVELSAVNLRSANGVIHELPTAVVLRKSIYEIIKTNPNYSTFYSYIRSNNSMVFNKDLSPIVGVDSLGRTVYDTIRTLQNTYLNQIGIDKESEVTTLFIPTNDLINTIFTTNFVAALGGDVSKINHIDTTQFKSKLYRHIALLNKSLNSNQLTSAMKSALGTNLKVSNSDITNPDIVASNGICHELSSLQLVDYLFQRNVTTSAQDINLLKLEKTSFPTSVTSRQIVKPSTYTTAGLFQLNLYSVGRSVTVDVCENLPLSLTAKDWRGVPPGYYNVILNFFSDATCCYLDVAYNNVNVSKQSIAAGAYRPTTKQDLNIGTIYVPAFGKVTLKFTNGAKSISTAVNLYIDNIKLIPAVAP